ncbi:MAG: DNA polymerase III subunit delta' [Bdellovibrionaceae bacterium]|nr:DNA polymerase III subunit delta' [Pseudobdellovibrionaceae bacterium]
MARLLGEVFGHKETIAKLLETFASQRPGQTFLFVGPNGVGKKKIAVGLAQALLCERTPMACGHCPSCLRVAANAHGSLKLIAPTGANIKIEESREVIEFLSLQSLTAKRVVIIDQAQSLNTQAANALLKILEEPPTQTYFFLIAPSAAGVLSTIRSRSRPVSFRPLTTADIARGAPESPEWAVRASQGSFEKLAQLKGGPEQEVRGDAFRILQQFLEDPDFLTDSSWREPFKERARAQRIMSYWISFLRDVLYYQEDRKASIMNVDQGDLLKKLGAKKRDLILGLIEKAMRVEIEILQNRDVQLLMEQFWIQNQSREQGMSNA